MNQTLTVINTSPHMIPELLVRCDRWYHALPNIEPFTDRVCCSIMACADQLMLSTAFSTYSISLLLTHDSEIQQLNRQYRGKDRPTNVLSFPLLTEDAVIEPFAFNDVAQEPLPLGDVVISIDTIEKEAQMQHKTLDAHYAHMLVHGILHLMGHDHIQKDEAEAMEALEVKILGALAISDPYK